MFTAGKGGRLHRLPLIEVLAEEVQKREAAELAIVRNITLATEQYQALLNDNAKQHCQYIATKESLAASLLEIKKLQEDNGSLTSDLKIAKANIAKLSNNKFNVIIFNDANTQNSVLLYLWFYSLYQLHSLSQLD